MNAFARDLRDPIYIGNRLDDLRDLSDLHTEGTTVPLSVLYDLNGANVPNYSGHLMGYYTAQEYLSELEGRTDRYAKSTLESIKLGSKPNPKDAQIV